jgi:sigma-B regulation protein RsbU (phosphoserine phosphatase)
LNRYASAYSLDGRRFTTAILGLYDPATGELTYVNAGHNAPVVRRSNLSMEFLDKGGLPLGIESTATYETGMVNLRAGDILLMFTDGVVEAFNAAGEEYGNGRWLEAIRRLPPGTASQHLQFLMGQVDSFVGATRQSDDITCLVFQCK